MLTRKQYVIGIGAFVLGVGGCSVEESTHVSSKSQAIAVQDWQEGTTFAVGDLVLFDSKTYRCISAHTAYVGTGWNPLVAASLWEAYEPELTIPALAPVGTLSTPLSLADVLVENDCLSSPENCCPLGSTAKLLTDAADTLQILTSTECVIAGHGADTLMIYADGPQALHLGPGDDTAFAGTGEALIMGGDGRDTIFSAQGGNHLFFGGKGDDSLSALVGDVRVVPGPGRDTVALGPGDDTAYIFDRCEVIAGETLSGGMGNDTLVIPAPLEEMLGLGLVVSGFENIVVESHACWSECREQPDCGGNGVCSDSAQGELRCECDEGWVGDDCSSPVKINVVPRSTEDIFDIQTGPGDALSRFAKFAFVGGNYPDNLGELRALPALEIASELQRALNASKNGLERFAIAYIANRVGGPEMLPIFKALVLEEVPLGWSSSDPHKKSGNSDVVAIDSAVTGLFNLVEGGNLEARQLFLIAAVHDVPAIQGRVGVLTQGLSDTSFRSQVLATLTPKGLSGYVAQVKTSGLLETQVVGAASDLDKKVIAKIEEVIVK